MRGSHWVKCDLHVHTPASFSHHYGDSQKAEVWERFVSDLESLPEEFKVLGINDYLTLDGYERLLSFKLDGRLSNISCLLPVIEFRINRFAGERSFSRVNYHVIFSDKIEPNIIQTQFLNSLVSSYTLESGAATPDWSAIPTDESLEDLGRRVKRMLPKDATLQNTSDWRVGFNNFNVDYDKLKETLRRPAFKDRVITAIGKSEWDDMRWNAGGAAEKRTVINEADIVFLAAMSVQQCVSAREKLDLNNVNSLLLDCSDAHCFSDSDQNTRIGNCNTWLKIEPTFDGLRQALFEPLDRVHIGESNPDVKSPYHVIEQVSFLNGGEHFTKSPIKLSSGLNAIIGGKSTGKSLLAGLIAKASDVNEYSSRQNLDSKNQLDWIKAKQPQLDFLVQWKDGEITNLNDERRSRRITYFPQHFLNSKINDRNVGNKELNQLIRNVLMQTPTVAQLLEEYREQLKHIDSNIASDSNLFEIKLKDHRDLSKLLGERGTSTDIRRNIERLTGELVELRGKYGLTTDELQTHQELNSTFREVTLDKRIYSDDLATLQLLNLNKIKQLLNSSLLSSSEISMLSENCRASLESGIATLIDDFGEKVYRLILDITDERKSLFAALQGKEAAIHQLHDPILTKIRNAEPLKDKDRILLLESQKLEEVERLENNIADIDTELDEIKDRLLRYVDEKISRAQMLEADIQKLPFADQESELKIDIDYRCKSSHIQSLLRDRIKYQSNQTVRSYLNENDFDDTKTDKYYVRIATLLAQARTGELELKGDNKLSNLIYESLSNAIYLNYNLKLGGDGFNIMSPGKKALALLKVLSS